MINDLRAFIDAVQITNEMGIPHFTLPLTQQEAARFIGINAEAMNDVKQNILVGYNSAGPQADDHTGQRCRPPAGKTRTFLPAQGKTAA